MIITEKTLNLIFNGTNGGQFGFSCSSLRGFSEIRDSHIVESNVFAYSLLN